MSVHISQLDEEQQVVVLRETAVRHKNLLEQQIAIHGRANMPTHLQILLEDFDKAINGYDKQLASIRRKKRRAQTLKQAAAVAKAAQRTVWPKRPPGYRRRSRVVKRLHYKFTRFAALGVLLICLFFTARLVIANPPGLTSQRAPAYNSNGSISISPDWQVGAAYKVANTGGVGVRLRSEPKQGSVLDGVINENTVVYVMERVSGEDGQIWLRVRTESGTPTYIRSKYLAPI